MHQTNVLLVATLLLGRSTAAALPGATDGSLPQEPISPSSTNSTAVPGSNSTSQRADAVKQTFRIAWAGYRQYAFPNDELMPVNNSFKNTRNGWGASAVDALSTAIIMGLSDITNDIVNYIPTIDWSVSHDDDDVSLFETTISLVQNENITALLDQAINLANNLSYAFDTPTGIPFNNLKFSVRGHDNSTTNGLATIGSLVLEWQHLSDLTGNQTYGDLAQKGESYLLNPKPAENEVWPGLLGSHVDIATGLFVDASGGWSSDDDSFYEYLIKMYVYDCSKYGYYKDRWVQAAESSISYLASHPESRPDLTYLAGYNNRTLKKQSGALACFDGGNFILGGLVLNEQKYVDFGLELVASCENLYSQTLTGIGPETFGWDKSSVPAGQEAFYERAGFYITDANYMLRPEVVESFYYAYRATGDSKYQEWSWNAFVAINSTTRVGSGYSEIANVNVVGGGSFTNIQDSFFFAEVLKYCYLIQAPDAVYQVNYGGANRYVFNTEAHPFKVAGTPI